MPTREEYNACMRPYISGKDKTKEERQLDFCAGAKICTGKATNMDQALKICRETPPTVKPPKSGKRGSTRSCPKHAEELVSCLRGALPFESLTKDNFQESLRQAVHQCECNKPAKKETKTQKAAKAYELMTDAEKATLEQIAVLGGMYAKKT